MKRTTIVEVITTLFVIIFLYTAISKIIDYRLFKQQITLNSFLKPIAGIIAIGLPIIEILIVLLLIVPKWRLKGLYMSLTLMIAFTGYVIYLLSSPDNIPCSCGGFLEELTWPQHIIFNSTFILMAFWGIILIKRTIKEKKSDFYSLIHAIPNKQF